MIGRWILLDGARLTVSLVSSLYAKLTTCYQFAVQSSNQTKSLLHTREVRKSGRASVSQKQSGDKSHWQFHNFPHNKWFYSSVTRHITLPSHKVNVHYKLQTSKLQQDPTHKHHEKMPHTKLRYNKGNVTTHTQLAGDGTHTHTHTSVGHILHFTINMVVFQGVTRLTACNPPGLYSLFMSSFSGD